MQPHGKLVLTLPTGQVQEFALAKESVTIGRATTSDIALRDAKISRAHAKLECTETSCTLIDLGSANGTRVNNQRVERAVLKPGDVIALGDSTLRFETGAPVADEPPLVPIHSAADLEATLAHATLSMTLSNTNAPRLAIHTAKRTWQMLLQDTLTIGRKSNNHIVLDDPKTSRQHARIERRGDTFVIRDLESRNGTWVGTQRIDAQIQKV